MCTAFLQSTPLSRQLARPTKALSPQRPAAHAPRSPPRRMRRRTTEGAATAPATSSQGQARTPPVQPVCKHVVIVGGGPAGLSSMLLLQKRRLAKRITILERSPASDTRSVVSPIREFAYLFDWRAGRFLDALPALQRRVKAAAWAFQPRLGHVFTRDCKMRSYELQGVVGPELDRFYFWTRRTTFLDACWAELEAQSAGVGDCDVRVLRGVICQDVEFAEGDCPIRVRFTDEAGAEHVVEADLLLGADGLHSVVRRALQRENELGKVTSSGSGPGFAMEKWTSPSVGLRYKSLRIPSGTIYLSDPDSDMSEVRMGHGMYAAVGESASLSGRSPFNIGCLPMGPLTSFGRLGTIILKPDHPLWDVHDVEECYKYFEANFPQLDVRKMIPLEEMQHFAEVDAGYFPPIQRAGGFVAHVGQGAVALVGDSAHCFPPDMAQGVNSALEDVLELCDGLQSEGLHGGVDFYEQRRDADIRSFMRIMRLGHPFQYRQSKLGMALFLTNLTIRKVLSKLAPDFFKPQISQLMYTTHSYSEILRLADYTTARIYGVSALALAVVGAGLLYAQHVW